MGWSIGARETFNLVWDILNGDILKTQLKKP